MKKYDKDTKAIFRSKDGEHGRNGEEMKVVGHKKTSWDESGFTHIIEFGDGHKNMAFPQEITPLDLIY